MSQPRMSITIDLDPLVKLSCAAFDCKHNLFHDNLNIGALCALKYVDIDGDHRCTMYAPDGEIKKEVSQ